MAIEFKKPSRFINRVFIHCSATSNKSITAADVYRWHVYDNKWSDIGYHYFIKSDGTLELGRDLEKTPAAQSGHNSGTIAICLNGLVVTDFSEEQFTTLRDLCNQINLAYKGEVTFHGHCEVSSKTCPVFNYRQVLNLDSSGEILPIAALKGPALIDFPELGTGASGSMVAIVQAILKMPPSGIFDRETTKVVAQFQKDHKISSEPGVVNKTTWQILLEELKRR